MTIYRKRPIQVEAIRYDGANAQQIADFMGGPKQAKAEERKLPGPGRGMHDGIIIHTLEGDMTASVGDWIIRGVRGEFYPIKDAIFRETYEPAFWAVHVQGPDDIVAAADRTDADRTASEINEVAEQIANLPTSTPNDPRLHAVVVPWPYTAEGHAEALAEQQQEGWVYTP